MKLKAGEWTESNVQANLTYRLLQLGLIVRQEVVPIGVPNTRFDNVVLSMDDDICCVIECKNAKTHKQAVQLEKEWRASEQGCRYQRLADRYDFKLFFCGGQTEIDRVVDEVHDYLNIVRRLFNKC